MTNRINDDRFISGYEIINENAKDEYSNLNSEITQLYG